MNKLPTMVGHDTDYAVYASEDNCPCIEPEQDTDTAEAYDAWDASHPWGEGLNWEGRICNLTSMGVYCQECSQDEGDWVGHTIRCHECGTTGTDCYCETDEEVTQ